MADKSESKLARTNKDQHRGDADQSATNYGSTEELIITDDTGIGIYEASIGGLTVAGVCYRKSGNRITLLATSVCPEFRGKGIPPKLLRGVLERIRLRGETVICKCPFAAEFVNAHPEYSDMLFSVDSGRPTRPNAGTLR